MTSIYHHRICQYHFGLTGCSDGEQRAPIAGQPYRSSRSDTLMRRLAVQLGGFASTYLPAGLPALVPDCLADNLACVNSGSPRSSWLAVHTACKHVCYMSTVWLKSHPRRCQYPYCFTCCISGEMGPDRWRPIDRLLDVMPWCVPTAHRLAMLLGREPCVWSDSSVMTISSA